MHAAKLTYHQEFRVCSLFQPYTLKTLLRNRLAKDRIWTPPRLQKIRIQAVRYNCSRISGLLLLHLCQVLDPDGLFARRLPIAFTGLKASVILGFCQRRFDLSAIMRLVMQSWFGCSYTYKLLLLLLLLLLGLCKRRIIISAFAHHRPGDTRCLIGQSHRSDIRMARRCDTHHPGT
jgi:hypothetical protein